MNILTIRKSLQDYIRFADEKKVKALFTIVEDEINQKQDLWAKTEFVDEMQQRSHAMETNKVNGNSWEIVKENSNYL